MPNCIEENCCRSVKHKCDDITARHLFLVIPTSLFFWSSYIAIMIAGKLLFVLSSKPHHHSLLRQHHNNMYIFLAQLLLAIPFIKIYMLVRWYYFGLGEILVDEVDLLTS